MLNRIIQFSLHNKLIVLLFTLFVFCYGIYALTHLAIGAVPDVTNNQVQVITTSRNLSTQDMEQYVTYPVELEMANIPGVKEIRSISKFGLSVVTIVFEEDMGTYLPRQLIAEKLKSAAERIPQGFGTPMMGPITTGLGEIYQYVLDVDPEFEDQYSITDLRTIQDWIVKRQLSGIPGVVEVNTWGGYLKQYEVAINTSQLQAHEVTTREVFEALQNNNHVVGGGYIEKTDQAHFIRGDGVVNDLDDIRDIVVTNKNGLPIYVRDIATVGYGSAPRFGAITGNGEGEKVLGQIMMLKDANTNDVISSVKDRVAQISSSLPPGVRINPFLERSELIDKTMLTVSENLIFGCLIVIFVVVILLGNIRSGLVVASVIPLSLLFAISMMYIFDIDANLMSLGAIDFGIIIDGAVIIVEYIAYKLYTQRETLLQTSPSQLQAAKDKITFSGASKMMNSAIFGQIIILIVFIPILSMEGVEGKMFKPMALVFGFALIGAMLMCLTYIPVMTSMILQPNQTGEKNISVKLIRVINRLYMPTIRAAMHHKFIVVGLAITLLGIASAAYNQMGSEFVPTLDEGDFVIQPVFKTGTSLEKTIEYTTQIENILLDSFQEVNQIVTRIGAAEVPTDPMSMEESDVIITLKPRDQWTNAKSKDELAGKFKEALAIIPGIEVEFTQPIEMRFNELITGVRSDVAIKIFGENLSILAKKGEEIKKLIADVEGAADITVEKIEGLPQMSVQYNRQKIARYGLQIKEVNEVVSMAFAGRKAGQVYLGEKRFDLVMRLGADKRTNIDDLKNLMIDLPQGGKVPLEELATITYQKGAAKIVREDTRRRIVIGVNVRNRDLQSVVDDIQALVDAHITLPPNYRITYGGQFENLQSASRRLLIAVPIALLLIFMMLYFAFKSIGEALLIFSAIPFAAIGGIGLLWIRDMPFSISAGVGFIALFGIAVLNGIVLLEHYKELEGDVKTYSDDYIIQGAKDRMRAVLLTALAAIFGFLPMAISTGAGAEVQRPLATVVVGGLISATFLTLVVLPVLYALYKQYAYNKIGQSQLFHGAVWLLLGMAFHAPLGAQEKAYDLQGLIDLGLQNNPGLMVNKAQIDKATALIRSANNLPKTQFYFSRDENNLALNDRPLNVFGVQQSFSLPSVYQAHRAVKRAEVQRYAYQEKLDVLRFTKELTRYYATYQTQLAKLKLYEKLDSIHAKLPAIAERRMALGEGSEMDRLNAITRYKRIHLQLELMNLDIEETQLQLQTLILADNEIAIVPEDPADLVIRWTDDSIDFNTNPAVEIIDAHQQWSEAQYNYLDQQALPDFSVEWFNGLNNDYVRMGFQVGVNVSLFPQQYKAQQDAIRFEQVAQRYRQQDIKNALKARYEKLHIERKRVRKELQFYEQEAVPLAEEIVRNAHRKLSLGEISQFQYLTQIESAYHIKIEQLDLIEKLNEISIQLHYLTID